MHSLLATQRKNCGDSRIHRKQISGGSTLSKGRTSSFCHNAPKWIVIQKECNTSLPLLSAQSTQIKKLLLSFLQTQAIKVKLQSTRKALTTCNQVVCCWLRGVPIGLFFSGLQSHDAHCHSYNSNTSFHKN